jgi:hypothetical protein
MKPLALIAVLPCVPACSGDLARVAVRNDSQDPIQAQHVFGKYFDRG